MRFHGISASSRLIALAAAILALAGCARIPNYNDQQPGVLSQAAAAPQNTPPPLKLCPAPSAPASLVATPGYTQLMVSVADANGAPVDSLKQSDFVVYSGATSYPIKYFDSGYAPQSIVFVIDTSGSMYEKLGDIQETLPGMISGLNACDEIAMFAFSDQPYLLMPFTTDHQTVIRVIAILHANGKTALFASMKRAISYQKRSASYPSRSLIVITDGMDNESVPPEREDIVKAVRESGVRLYLVGIGDPDAGGASYAIGPFIVNSGPLYKVDNPSLDAFADETGTGKPIIVKYKAGDNSGTATKALDSITASLADTYTIGVVAPSASDTLTVAVPSKPSAVITSTRTSVK